MKKEVVRAVYDRYGPYCAWCWRPHDLQIHHVDHKGMGGRKGEAKEESEDPDNLALLCLVCHAAAHGERLIASDNFNCDICQAAWACNHRQLSEEGKKRFWKSTDQDA